MDECGDTPSLLPVEEARFCGVCDIFGVAVSPLDVIALHARNLDILAVNSLSPQHIVRQFEVVEDEETLRIFVEPVSYSAEPATPTCEALGTVQYALRVVYLGLFSRPTERGVYSVGLSACVPPAPVLSDTASSSPSPARSSGKEDVSFCSTYLEPAHARTLFPVIDEPSAKAVFQLQLLVHESLTCALGNAPLVTSSLVSGNELDSLYGFGAGAAALIHLTDRPQVVPISAESLNPLSEVLPVQEETCLGDGSAMNDCSTPIRSNVTSSGARTYDTVRCSTYRHIVFAASPLMSPYLLTFFVASGYHSISRSVPPHPGARALQVRSLMAHCSVPADSRAALESARQAVLQRWVPTELSVHADIEEPEEPLCVTTYVPETVPLEDTLFASSLAVAALQFYSYFYGIPLGFRELRKLDLIGIATLGVMGMENVACEQFLLSYFAVNKDTTLARVKRISRLIGHEITHQWFGNAVSLSAWGHLWLKEGFARMLEFLFVDMLYPEWQMWTLFVCDVMHALLRKDLWPCIHPVDMDSVSSPKAAEARFDSTSYEKGASLLRMLFEFVGTDVLHSAIRQYVAMHYSGTATSVDLLRYVVKACQEQTSSSPAGLASAFSVVGERSLPYLSPWLTCHFHDSSRGQPAAPKYLHISANVYEVRPLECAVDLMTEWLTATGHPVVYITSTEKNPWTYDYYVCVDAGDGSDCIVNFLESAVNVEGDHLLRPPTPSQDEMQSIPCASPLVKHRLPASPPVQPAIPLWLQWIETHSVASSEGSIANAGYCKEQVATAFHVRAVVQGQRGSIRAPTRSGSSEHPPVLLFNARQTAFCRVVYDFTSWRRLMQVYHMLPNLDRTGLAATAVTTYHSSPKPLSCSLSNVIDIIVSALACNETSASVWTVLSPILVAISVRLCCLKDHINEFSRFMCRHLTVIFAERSDVCGPRCRPEGRLSSTVPGLEARKVVSAANILHVRCPRPNTCDISESSTDETIRQNLLISHILGWLSCHQHLDGKESAASLLTQAAEEFDQLQQSLCGTEFEEIFGGWTIADMVHGEMDAELREIELFVRICREASGSTLPVRELVKFLISTADSAIERHALLSPTYCSHCDGSDCVGNSSGLGAKIPVHRGCFLYPIFRIIEKVLKGSSVSSGHKRLIELLVLARRRFLNAIIMSLGMFPCSFQILVGLLDYEPICLPPSFIGRMERRCMQCAFFAEAHYRSKLVESNEFREIIIRVLCACPQRNAM